MNSVSMESAMTACLKAIYNCKDGGRKRCELFIDLPDKQTYPDYYDAIREPICLSKVIRRSFPFSFKLAFSTCCPLSWCSLLFTCLHLALASCSCLCLTFDMFFLLFFFSASSHFVCHGYCNIYD